MATTEETGMNKERAEAVLEASEEGVTEEAAVTPEPEVIDAEFVEESQPAPPPLKVGYVVGLTEEGNFVFEILGSQRGLVELLGIHQYADRKITAIYDDNQMSGDRLVHEVGKASAMALQKLDQLIGAQKKPDNQI
jgi:hypothetical protein